MLHFSPGSIGVAISSLRAWMQLPAHFKNSLESLRYLSQKLHIKTFLWRNSLDASTISSFLAIPTTRFSHNCSSTTYASSFLSQTRRLDIYSYNAIIKDFVSDSQNAALSYVKMLRDGVHPNKHTIPLLLKSKTHIPFQILAHVIKFGFGSDHFVRNSLICAFASSGRIESARQVFDEMTHRDTITYTALMDGYIRNTLASNALELFLEMRLLDVLVDEVAVVSALRAVGMLGCVWLGKWIHGFYVESGRVSPDAYIGSALVDMYSKCGFCEDALKVFQDMPYNNLVCWSTLLAGYVQCSKFDNALRLFQDMLVQKIEPNEVILVSVLTACANLGALDQGRWVVKYIAGSKLKISSQLGTALIDMYAKCGCIDEASSVFQKLKVKDVYPWTALIFGLAMNGDTTGAINLFNEMLSSGVGPNGVTFLAVLSACSHGGCVDEGKQFFALMECVYDIKPTVDHYGCMVDLLGRAGQLREAVELMTDMPMERSAGIWGALFGACMIHKDFELGKIVGNYLIQLQPERSGRYALLANLYLKYGDREAAANVRKNLKGVGKTPGCSWISVNGMVHEFVSFDNLHSELESVYEFLDRLTGEIQRIPLVLEGGFLIL